MNKHTETTYLDEEKTRQLKSVINYKELNTQCSNCNCSDDVLIKDTRDTYNSLFCKAFPPFAFKVSPIGYCSFYKPKETNQEIKKSKNNLTFIQTNENSKSNRNRKYQTYYFIYR